MFEVLLIKIIYHVIQFKIQRVILLLTLSTFLVPNILGQVNYSSNLDVQGDASGEGNWDDGGFNGSNSSACSGYSMRDNCYGTGTSQVVDMNNTNSLGTSLGGDLTVQFDYKLLEYSGLGATPGADLKYIKVYSGTSNSGPWTEEYSITSHTASTSCVTESFTFSRAAGATFIKFETEHSNVSSPDFYIYIDDISVVESLCNDPVATYTVVPDCNNGQFSIDVNVTSLGDATGVDITDGTTTFQTNVGTGTYTVGPFTAGVNKTIQVNGASYAGCDIASGTLTEACNCVTVPTATISSTNLDCATFDYDIEVTVTNFGSGTGADIYIDNALVQGSAVLSNLYTFSGYATGSHNVDVRATGPGFVTCETSSTTTENCNGSDDWSTLAPDILGTCGAGDFTTATVSAAIGFTPSCDDGGAGGSTANNFIRDCSAANFNNNTDWVDLWYQVDLPDGTDEMTLTVTGLAAQEIVGYVLHTGDPGVNASNNVATTTGNFVCSFFDQTVTAHIITGLAGESTAPLYIRVLPINFDDNTGCAGMTVFDFTICASAPQPNDVCGDAIDIVNSSTFLPETASGDISQANIDADTHDEVNGETCGGINFTTSEEDLWYNIETPASGKYYLDVDIDFTGTADEIYVLLHNYCSAGDTDPIGCANISADGTVVFDQNNITNFDNALSANTNYKIRIVKPTGSTATSFDITGNLIAENNNCELMHETFPGFDLDAGQLDANFNFASESGAVPTQTGNDLWFQFDPLNGSDNSNSVYSTSVDLQVGGLLAGQELTIMLYKENASNDCSNLATDYITTETVTSNGTVIINCLDEVYGDRYIVRVIQTAGTTADNVSLEAFPNPIGPFNNDAENIWNGSGPKIVGGGSAANNFNPWFIPSGSANFVVDDFENSTDCHPNISSAFCSGVDNAAFTESDDRDLWFVFEVPSDSCGANGLTSSSVISTMDITYNAGNSFRDAKLYVYDGLTDADLVDCSSTLDGGAPGSTWTVSGLTQGESYLLRVKPSRLNSDFEYSFDITVEDGPVRPCNDDKDGAEDIGTIETGFDRSVCPSDTYSAQGASDSGINPDGWGDVWFTFVAPNNGGPYVTQEGYVTLYLDGTSGHDIKCQIYDATGTSELASSTTNSQGDAWAHAGHLTPGDTYYVRVAHNESVSEEVNYRLCFYQSDVIENCPITGSNEVSGGIECGNDCSLFYKVDLPEQTPSGFYRIEVIGDGTDVEARLRSQGSDSPSNEGNITDIDHPCNAGGNLGVVSSGALTDPGSCNGGTGEWKVYNLIGPALNQRNYYYLEVYDPVDVLGCGGLAVCEVKVYGPFTTQAIAENTSNTVPDGLCASPLPVELIDFDGYHLLGDNELKWSTVTEINNDYFEIEASVDGYEFQVVGKVDGSGNSNQQINYGFKHEDVAVQLMYYRLVQYDYDGTRTVSEVIAIESELENRVVIYPNPVKGLLNIVSTYELSRIVVLDVTGKVVKTVEGSTNQIDLSELNKGIYFINLEGKKGVDNFKIVVE